MFHNKIMSCCSNARKFIWGFFSVIATIYQKIFNILHFWWSWKLGTPHDRHHPCWQFDVSLITRMECPDLLIPFKFILLTKAELGKSWCKMKSTTNDDMEQSIRTPMPLFHWRCICFVLTLWIWDLHWTASFFWLKTKSTAAKMKYLKVMKYRGKVIAPSSKINTTIDLLSRVWDSRSSARIGHHNHATTVTVL